jgi:hypothetical protein
VLPSEVLKTEPLGRLRTGAMCTIPPGIEVEAASAKVTCEPVVALNRDWSAGVGDDQLTGAVSLRAAGTSESRARAATAKATGKDTRWRTATRALDIGGLTLRGVSDDEGDGFRPPPRQSDSR